MKNSLFSDIKMPMFYTLMYILNLIKDKLTKAKIISLFFTFFFFFFDHPSHPVRDVSGFWLVPRTSARLSSSKTELFPVWVTSEQKTCSSTDLEGKLVAQWMQAFLLKT
jgi:hypothetical protein